MAVRTIVVNRLDVGVGTRTRNLQGDPRVTARDLDMTTLSLLAAASETRMMSLLEVNLPGATKTRGGVGALNMPRKIPSRNMSVLDDERSLAATTMATALIAHAGRPETIMIEATGRTDGTAERIVIGSDIERMTDGKTAPQGCAHAP